jgi:SAM-dependent methyltransferase
LMPSSGGACLDWSLKYITKFGTACTRLYNYQYSPTQNIFRESQGPKAPGSISGDLANLSHVPSGILDLVIATEVFEHIPYFWRAMPTLGRLVRPGGFLVFTVPFMYEFHLSPADFWRMTHLAVYHLLESSGFAVCKLLSDGIRGAQMTLLGFTYKDIDRRFVSTSQPKEHHYYSASGFAFLAQRVADPTTSDDAVANGRAPGMGPLKCDEAARKLPTLNGEIQIKDLLRAVKSHKGIWPAPNPKAFEAGREEPIPAIKWSSGR